MAQWFDYHYSAYDPSECEQVAIAVSKYCQNDSLAVILVCEEDGWVEEFDTITVNIDWPGADERHAFVDVNNAPKVTEFLESNGLARPTGTYGASGYCMYPLYEFTEKLFAATANDELFGEE